MIFLVIMLISCLALIIATVCAIMNERSMHTKYNSPPILRFIDMCVNTVFLVIVSGLFIILLLGALKGEISG